MGRLSLSHFPFGRGGDAAVQVRQAADRLFPEVAETVPGLAARKLVLDAALIVPIGDRLSFDALQMRHDPMACRPIP